MSALTFPVELKPSSRLGGLRVLDDSAVLPNGIWYEAEEAHDGVLCLFPSGTLVGATHLTFDVLVPGSAASAFGLYLCEGETGPQFLCHFAFLPECQGRVRLPIEALSQNRWLYPREGSWLKVICAGDRVDPAKVDRLRFVCFRKAEGPVRWCMTAIQAVATEPPMLSTPLLPRGSLLDALGQSTLTTWAGKTSDQSELVSRLQQQHTNADQQRWPESFSRLGGWKQRQFDASGYFRTDHDGQRWWLVDPDGYAFWSAGLDCVRSSITTNATHLQSALTWVPEAERGFADAVSTTCDDLTIDYLRANFIRAFGPNHWHDRWASLAIAMMRQLGFNTVANWSEWDVASAAGFPYVRPLQWPVKDGQRVARIFRDFPDVFDPTFASETADYARQLLTTRDDPALMGYFLMNEPTWGFASQTPAEGMLFNTDRCASRDALAKFLHQRYPDDQALATAWGSDVCFAHIEQGRWQQAISDGARADLEAFSTILVERLFAMLTDACRAVDANHLNLGARYHHVPPPWAMQGMGCFDVFSVNGYRERVDRALADACMTMNCPALIGEWHFGALDVGLPASGIGRVANQADRGRAYRVYLEDAAAQPWCVGVHYFTMYDQSAMGRGDGENYNIGFVDICHTPYEPLANAARLSHERLYEVADGQVPPFDDAPEYLPRLFY